MTLKSQGTPRRRGGRRARLSRELVLHAAMALADEGGLPAMTMHGIGEGLGVEAMSLYRHVRNKDDILDGLADLVYGEIDLPDADADWRTAMRRRAQSTRDVLARHPWAVDLMESRTSPGPANLRHHDAVLGILRRAGFSSAVATHAYNLLDSYIYGFALQARSIPVATPEALAEVGEVLIGQLPGDEYPNLKAVGADLMASGFDYGAEFAFGLDLILDALDRLPRD
jgi:AcrR family transcriptional regulator